MIHGYGLLLSGAGLEGKGVNAGVLCIVVMSYPP